MRVFAGMHQCYREQQCRRKKRRGFRLAGPHAGHDRRHNTDPPIHLLSSRLGSRFAMEIRMYRPALNSIITHPCDIRARFIRKETLPTAPTYRARPHNSHCEPRLPLLHIPTASEAPPLGLQPIQIETASRSCPAARRTERKAPQARDGAFPSARGTCDGRDASYCRLRRVHQLSCIPRAPRLSSRLPSVVYDPDTPRMELRIIPLARPHAAPNTRDSGARARCPVHRLLRSVGEELRVAPGGHGKHVWWTGRG
ncbi:hypothetical protein DFH09DRAFT_1374649 [Mycena vulgaris]|nr:hypothetical protein DFH09DRAFT_1374649 [Mycena vulgaris]